LAKVFGCDGQRVVSVEMLMVILLDHDARGMVGMASL